MILIIAPYLPVGNSVVNLGAARKLEGCIGALYALGDDIILLNTAQRNDFSTQERILVGGVPVKQYSVAQGRNPGLRNALNIYFAKFLLAEILSKEGLPRICWCYNGYSIEMRLCRHLKSTMAPSVLNVLEFEDWHFARRRFMNIKPLLDCFFWWRALPFLDYAFCVSPSLIKKVGGRVRSALLPGVIPNGILSISRVAISKERSDIVVGYFGGFVKEKGADKIPEIARRTSCRFIVCGSGPLAPILRECAKQFGDRFELHEGLSSAEMEDCYSRCDIIINPHVVSKEFREGVFPSKVVEAIGSGAVVVSTELPNLGIESVDSTVVYVDDCTDGFVAGINRVVENFQFYFLAAQTARAAAVDLFSTSALTGVVTAQLDADGLR